MSGVHLQKALVIESDLVKLLSQPYPRLRFIKKMSVLEHSPTLSTPLCEDNGDGIATLTYSVIRFMHDREMLFDLVLAQAKRIQTDRPSAFIRHTIEDIYFEQYQKRLAALDP